MERERMDRGPAEACVKCKGNSWYRDIDPGVWYCFLCGNTAYLDGTTYRQRKVACSTSE